MQLNSSYNKNDEVNIFDDEDWNFISADTVNDFGAYEYFSDVKDLNLEDSAFDIFNKILSVILAFALVLILGITTFGIISNRTVEKERQEVESVKDSDTVEISKVEYVDGTEVDGATLSILAHNLNDYFGVLHDGTELSKLNDYCADGSIIAQNDEMYRQNVKYSYDYNDCYSRAIRGFSKYVSYIRIDKALEYQGEYYCYATLTVPYYYGFNDYFRIYASDMRQFFTQEEITSIGVMKYINRALGFNDLPLLQTQYLIKMNKEGKILDDLVIYDVLANSYTQSVNAITGRLGQTVDMTK